jgi:hypothetical protein
MIVRQVDLESEDGRSMTCNVDDRPDLKVGVWLSLNHPVGVERAGDYSALLSRKWRIMRLGERRGKPRQDWKVGGLS